MSLAFAFRRFALAAAFASVAVGASAGVSVRFSSSDPTATPFPSDRFTVRDWGNNTFRRVSLPDARRLHEHAGQGSRMRRHRGDQ